MSQVISPYVLQAKLSSIYLCHRNRKNYIFHTYIYTTPDTKSKSEWFLNWKTASVLWLLKAIWSLQQFKIPLQDFLNLVVVCKEMSPRYGNGRVSLLRNYCLLRTFYDQLINNRFKNFHNKWQRVPIFKKYLFWEIKFFMKFCPARINFKTLVS